MKKQAIAVAAAVCFLTYDLHGSDSVLFDSVVLSAGFSVVTAELHTLLSRKNETTREKVIRDSAGILWLTLINLGAAGWFSDMQSFEVFLLLSGANTFFSLLATSTYLTLRLALKSGLKELISARYPEEKQKESLHVAS